MAFDNNAPNFEPNLERFRVFIDKNQRKITISVKGHLNEQTTYTIFFDKKNNYDMAAFIAIL